MPPLQKLRNGVTLCCAAWFGQATWVDQGTMNPKVQAASHLPPRNTIVEIPCGNSMKIRKEIGETRFVPVSAPYGVGPRPRKEVCLLLPEFPPAAAIWTLGLGTLGSLKFCAMRFFVSKLYNNNFMCAIVKTRCIYIHIYRYMVYGHGPILGILIMGMFLWKCVDDHGT
jgi:hypothetical protein